MPPKLFKSLLSLWAILQLPRFIALPLIFSVLANSDPAAWLFPAVIDIVVAVGGLLVLLGLWRAPSLWSWLYIIVWLVISIFDHASAVTAFSVSGVPTIFKEFGSSGVGVPLFQSLIDALFILLLCLASNRRQFFLLKGE